MARPNTGKDYRVAMRLDEAEHSALEALMAYLDCSKSDAVRFLLDIELQFNPRKAKDGAVRVIAINTDRIASLMHEMNRQGQNLNQITRAISGLALNRTEISAKDLESFKSEIRALNRKYEALYDEVADIRDKVIGV